MAKKLDKYLNKLKSASLFMVVAVLGSLFVAGAVIYFLILPQFSSLSKIQNDNRLAQNKLTTIEQNISKVKSLDKEKIASYSALIEKLLPSEADHLRVAALLEVVAAASGGTISNLQSTNTTANTQSGAVAPARQTIGTGKSNASSSTVGTGTKGSYFMEFDFSGSYTAVETFLSALKFTDRALSIASLSLNFKDGNVVTTVELTVPLFGLSSASADPATPFVGLTTSEQKEVDAVRTKILYSASPANDPISRSNPLAPY